MYGATEEHQRSVDGSSNPTIGPSFILERVPSREKILSLSRLTEENHEQSIIEGPLVILSIEAVFVNKTFLI